MYVCMYVCMYVYMCIYVYMYIYVYMNICTYITTLGEGEIFWIAKHGTSPTPLGRLSYLASGASEELKPPLRETFEKIIRESISRLFEHQQFNHLFPASQLYQGDFLHPCWSKSFWNTKKNSRLPLASLPASPPKIPGIFLDPRGLHKDTLKARTLNVLNLPLEEGGQLKYNRVGLVGLGWVGWLLFLPRNDV